MRDIYNTKHRYSLAVKKLNRSIIHDSDKKAIKEYVNYRVAGGLGIHRAIKYMGTLRLLAEHLPCTFDNATLENITDLVAWVHLDKDTECESKTFFRPLTFLLEGLKVPLFLYDPFQNLQGLEQSK